MNLHAGSIGKNIDDPLHMKLREMAAILDAQIVSELGERFP
jgi:hypothetical protein